MASDDSNPSIRVDPGKLGIVQTKPTAFKASAGNDALGKVSGKVKSPGKPPTSPKSSGTKRSSK